MRGICTHYPSEVPFGASYFVRNKRKYVLTKYALRGLRGFGTYKARVRNNPGTQYQSLTVLVKLIIHTTRIRVPVLCGRRSGTWSGLSLELAIVLAVEDLRARACNLRVRAAA